MTVKLSLLVWELEQAELSVSGCAEEVAERLAENASWHEKAGKFVRVDWPTVPQQIDINAADVVVQAHDETGELPWIENKAEVKQMVLNLLANKTPAEIYTMEQANIDAISSLAEAKTFLRSRIPLIEAVLAWALNFQDG